MRPVLVMFMVILALRANELSCSLQAVRDNSGNEHPANPKMTKQLRKRASIVSNGMQQNQKADWQINFICRNPVKGQEVEEKFACGSEYNKLKFVFIQNKKISSTFIDLQPSLISFNKFVGLDLKNLSIKAVAGNCEIWIETSSIFKAFVALIMAWFL